MFCCFPKRSQRNAPQRPVWWAGLRSLCRVNSIGPALSGTNVATQNRSDHGGRKRARNHSAAEIAGFFASPAAKEWLAAMIFEVSLTIPGSSQQQWLQVAAASGSRKRGVEFKGGSRHDRNCHNRWNCQNRQNRHGSLLVLYFAGQAKGGQGAIQNRQKF